MKLKDKVKPPVPPLESSVYMAVCVLVADLGDQYSEKYKKASRKVVFSFDIPSETIEIDGELKPRQLSKRATFSASKKGALYKLLNAWLNSNMNESELGELDLFSLVGHGCQIRVTVSEDGLYNNIEDIMALPKGVSAPVSHTTPITYDIDVDGFSGKKWDMLPDWIKAAVEKSEQYRQDPPDKPLDMPAPDGAEQGEEDCPI